MVAIWHSSPILSAELLGNIQCGQVSFLQFDVISLFSKTLYQEFGLIPVGMYRTICTVTSFSFSPFYFFTFIWCWGRTVIMSQIGSRKRIRPTNLPPGESTSRKHGATPSSTQSQSSKPPQINLSLMAPCKPGKKPNCQPIWDHLSTL